MVTFNPYIRSRSLIIVALIFFIPILDPFLLNVTFRLLRNLIIVLLLACHVKINDIRSKYGIGLAILLILFMSTFGYLNPENFVNSYWLGPEIDIHFRIVFLLSLSLPPTILAYYYYPTETDTKTKERRKDISTLLPETMEIPGQSNKKSTTEEIIPSDTCPTCRNSISTNAKICYECGTPIISQN